MGEKYKQNRRVYISVIIVGMGIFFGSIGLIATEGGWNAFAVVSFVGFMILIIGVSGFLLNSINYKNSRDYKENLKSTRSVMRLSDIEIERMVEDTDLIDLEQFEQEQGTEFVFKYVLIIEKPKNAICMISKTPIEKNETVLQCPNCENYYLCRYLLGWLKKNSECPICKFLLKVKK